MPRRAPKRRRAGFCGRSERRPSRRSRFRPAEFRVGRLIRRCPVSSKSEKTSIILSACKYAAACAVLPAVLLAAGAAGAADAYQTGNGGGAVTDPSAQDSTYVPTPIGPKSEAWGDDPTGPGHLRRMSPTEALPAEPQVEKVIEVPSYGVPGGN